MLSVQEIKRAFVEYHHRKGFRVLDSFPLVSNDPTVMFVNATITPLKESFMGLVEQEDCAFVQKCFRMGGASELEIVGVNPYCHTFFEMLGSAAFGMSHVESIAYLLEFLDGLGILRERMYFTIPDDIRFKESLLVNSIPSHRVFSIRENGVFWQEWRFGRYGPIGKGLTLIYARSQKEVSSLRQITEDTGRFVELGNLIYVDAREAEDGKIVPVVTPGFDLGIGLERLAALLQGCNNYQINSIKPLVKEVASFFDARAIPAVGESTIRALTDHLRAICVLTEEGIMPSNKKHGYVLRKLIRRFLGITWRSVGQVISVETILTSFCEHLSRISARKIPCSAVVDAVRVESIALERVLKKTSGILERKPDISSALLRDRYGLSSDLADVLKKGGFK